MNKKPLSDLVTIISGGTPKRSNEEYWDGQIQWISVKDFHQGKHINHTEESITESGLMNSSTNLLEKDDIIISARGTVGLVSMIVTPMAFNQSIFGLRVQDELTPEYLYYWLKLNIPYIKNNVHGSVFDTITRDTFKIIEVSYPSLEEQEKATESLRLLDSKIEMNTQLNDNLLELGRSYYQNFLDTHDTEGQMVSTIAKSVITGKTPSTKDESNYGDDVPFVTIPDMHSQIFTTKTTRSLSKKGADSQVKKYLPPFTLSVSSIGTPGLVTINPEESQTNQQINSVIAEKEKIWYLFLAFDSLKAHIENMGSGGSTILNLNKSNFEKIDIDWPIDKSALIEFNTVIEPIFMNILNNQREIDSLSMVRDTLLSELI